MITNVCEFVCVSTGNSTVIFCWTLFYFLPIWGMAVWLCLAIPLSIRLFIHLSRQPDSQVKSLDTFSQLSRYSGPISRPPVLSQTAEAGLHHLAVADDVLTKTQASQTCSVSLDTDHSREVKTGGDNSSVLMSAASVTSVIYSRIHTSFRELKSVQRLMLLKLRGILT